MEHNSVRAGVDAFTAEVIRSSVVAITDEMKTNLMRTAYNMIIYEAEDFTVGLFDADGNTISIGLGLPMFIRGLSDAIKAKLAHWGKENLRPGDILLTNDPQVMGSHLNHMIFSLPIFHNGELIAFSSSMGHWQDVGGVLGKRVSQRRSQKGRGARGAQEGHQKTGHKRFEQRILLAVLLAGLEILNMGAALQGENLEHPESSNH